MVGDLADGCHTPARWPEASVVGDLADGSHTPARWPEASVVGVSSSVLHGATEEHRLQVTG